MNIFFLTTIVLQVHSILSASTQTTINFSDGLISMDSRNAFSIRSGDDPYSRLNVSSVGDINGDDISDLIVVESITQIYVLYGGRESFGKLTLPPFNDNTSFYGFKISLDLSSGGTIMSINSFGDFNKDGINDIIIPISPGNYDVEIKAIMIYGKKNRGHNNLILESNLSKTDGFKIFTMKQMDYSVSNFSVIRTGDINNDGIDDGLIRIQHTETNVYDKYYASKKGMLYTVYGHAYIYQDIDLETLPNSSKFRIYDHNPNEMLLIEWIGDINHDGIQDFAARSPADGELYVIYGRIGGFSDMNITTMSNSQGFRIKGSGPRYISNYYFKHAGDLNGDGIDDLIIGAEKNIPFKPLYVIYGKASGFSDIDLDNFSISDGFRVIQSAGTEYMGTSSTHLGDVNNDGFDDILILSKSSRGYLIFGQKDRRPDIDTTLAETLLIFNGANELFKAGDLNGDGIDDIVIRDYSFIYGLYGSNCEEYTQCSSPMPSICYASKGCACRNKNMIMQDSSCVSSCSPGYYRAHDSTCKICSENCKVCSSNPACEACFNGYFLQDSLCVSSCSNGSFVQDSLCVSSCSNGYLLQGSLCTKSCSYGYIKLGSICQPTGVIIGSIIGVMTVLIIGIIATIYARRRRRHTAANNNKITFPPVRFESEMEIKMSTTPVSLGKYSNLEQPIENVYNNNNRHSMYTVREEEKENSHDAEGMDMNDQQKVEYEFRVKRA